jgi:hypothetical protein
MKQLDEKQIQNVEGGTCRKSSILWGCAFVGLMVATGGIGGALAVGMFAYATIDMVVDHAGG